MRMAQRLIWILNAHLLLILWNQGLNQHPYYGIIGLEQMINKTKTQQDLIITKVKSTYHGTLVYKGKTYDYRARDHFRIIPGLHKMAGIKK